MPNTHTHTHTQHVYDIRLCTYQVDDVEVELYASNDVVVAPKFVHDVVRVVDYEGAEKQRPHCSYKMILCVQGLFGYK